ncbi:hypothetical protein M407DRAFT_21015 [Tulasnella calospora MUT 4182]|uniref:Uncharacterized protein n=1 Tax=Tulasnella calospora MUT 4182 TaxID=1051891 RepID=A0A0C3QP40_9AGAM|nr:hypothetical protein M407DRAFT_21015 [Tulasnella calospora MUT 4182]
MEYNVNDFTANGLVGMVALTATRASADAVTAVRFVVSEQHFGGLSLLELAAINNLPRWLLLFRDLRSGSAVMAAVPQLESSFGLVTTPEAYLDQEVRRLGEERATLPAAWGLETPHSSPYHTVSFMPPTTSVSELPATQEDGMEVDGITAHDIGEAVDAAQELDNISSSTSSSSSDLNVNYLSDEETMGMMEERLRQNRTNLSAGTLQLGVHEGLVAQQTEQELEGISGLSLAEEVAVRESWVRGEEGAEEVEIAGLRAVKADLKLASLLASSQ